MICNRLSVETSADSTEIKRWGESSELFLFGEIELSLDRAVCIVIGYGLL